MLRTVLDQFKLYLSHERGVSSHTYQAYASDILQFIEFVEPGDLNQDTLNDFLHFLSSKYTATATLARKRSAIKQFLSFASSEDFIQDSPYIAKLKGEVTLPKGLSRPQINQFFHYLYSSQTVLKRDIALVELIYSAALRVSEVISIALCDFDSEQTVLKVRGKGAKERLVPLHRKTIMAIQDYLDTERHLQDSSHPFLFLNQKGTGLTRQGAYTILRQLSVNAGLPPVHPHQFRHACATHLLEKGVPLLEIQALLGHESLTTTQRYTSVSKSLLKSVYEGAHPRS